MLTAMMAFTFSPGTVCDGSPRKLIFWPVESAAECPRAEEEEAGCGRTLFRLRTQMILMSFRARPHLCLTRNLFICASSTCRVPRWRREARAWMILLCSGCFTDGLLVSRRVLEFPGGKLRAWPTVRVG